MAKVAAVLHDEAPAGQATQVEVVAVPTVVETVTNP